MLYIETNSTDAAFHFSVEEYIAGGAVKDKPVLMLWRADKCVMLGSYQVAAAEVNSGFAMAEGIQITRRRSGGGAIFADMGTILYTMILPCPTGNCPVEQSPAGQNSRESAKHATVAPIIAALNKMGVPAVLQGRNDILVDGKKFSGIAQYIRGEQICTHGSILYDTDLDMLAEVLNVDEDKIRSKAIRSVRSRVTNIRSYVNPPCETDEFMRRLKCELLKGLGCREYTLSSDDFAEIDKIYRERYANPMWTFGNSPKFSLHGTKRFPEGRVEVYLDVAEGIVAHCLIRGDFLGTIPIRGLEEFIEGRVLHYEEMSGALGEIALQPYLGGIEKEHLLSCMFD